MNKQQKKIEWPQYRDKFLKILPEIKDKKLSKKEYSTLAAISLYFFELAERQGLVKKEKGCNKYSPESIPEVWKHFGYDMTIQEIEHKIEEA